MKNHQRYVLSAGIYGLVGATLCAAGWVAPDPRLGSALWWMGLLALATTGAFAILAITERAGARRRKERDRWQAVRAGGHVRLVEAPPYDWAKDKG